MSTPDPQWLDAAAGYLATGAAPGLAADEREDLDRLRGLLADDATWQQPPPELVEEIIASVERSPAPLIGRRVGRLRSRWVLAGGLAAAAVLAVVLVVARQSSPHGGNATQVALAGTDLAPGASAIATVRETPTGVAVTLDVEDLGPAPACCYYQAWVKGPAGLVAIGTFHLRGGADEPVQLWSGVDLDRYPELTVTLEPEDGDPASSERRVLASG